MMNLKLLYQWKGVLTSRLSSLNRWQVENVALFSYGVIEAESCQQQSVARKAVCGRSGQPALIKHGS